MDLALALGRDVGSMSEREFRRWAVYFRRKSSPTRRMEILLAHLAMLIDRHMGGAQNASIDDYLIEPARDENGLLVDPVVTVSSTDNEEYMAEMMERELMR